MNQPIIVEHLHVRYPDSGRWVLQDVSLAVDAGETVLILGPSGCGKSTLAFCLNGLIPHLIDAEMTGEVRIWGQATTTQTVGRLCQQVGEVFQDPEAQMVMPRLDEEIAFGLENLAVPCHEMQERIVAALAQVGLEGRCRDWVDSLSGGQKQRLALAAVLALHPTILVLDEPTANLDPAATISFFDTLARLKAELGITIVLIEHRLDTVLPLVDRVVVMNRRGQILAQGTPRQVFASHAGEMESEGIWLPETCRLTRALAAHGRVVAGCPLSLSEMEAALRGGGEAFGEKFMPHEGTHPSVQPTMSAPNASLLHDHIIDVADLTFAYPGGPEALRGATLRIKRGSFCALVGANGSGKTTLAKHLVGLLRAQGGSVTILGRDARRQSKWQLARQVGYVFQNPEHQFVTERVADELAYSLQGRWHGEESRRRVQSLLRTFGLEGYQDANPFALSQGQKRRLSVATMVALDQPILILDEPTFGQDQQSTAALMSTLRALHAAGATILFITHDMQLVAEHADEVAVMDEGRVIFQGTPRHLFQRPEIMQRASLTRPPLAELAHRLGLPPLLTVEEWSQWVAQGAHVL